MVSIKTINDFKSFVAKNGHKKLVENDKIVLRKFLRSLEGVDDLDNYAMDYSDDDFRISLVKGREERIFLLQKDNILKEIKE
jgi:hypothetical protein